MKSTCESDDGKYHWVVAGSIFKDYQMESEKGRLHPLVATNYGNRVIEFYWADTGDNRTVKVTFKRNGEDRTIEKVFRVKEPVVTIELDPPPLGEITLVGKLLSFGDPIVPGIRFKAKVALPAGFEDPGGKSKWGWTQIMTQVYRIQKNEFFGTCSGQLSGFSPLLPVGDSTPFYGDGPYAIGSEQSDDDSPGTAADPVFNSQKNVHDIWETYVMFLPPETTPVGGPSKWVALRTTEWWWKACVSKVEELMVIVNSSRSANAWGGTSSHPQWNGTFIALPDEPDVICPPPCEPE